MPKTWFELPPDQSATTLFVTWRDPRGEEAGVFPIPFDPDQALRASLKNILRDTSTAWLAFGGDGKPLVYFTHLFSYRCAIKEAKYGVNDSAVTTLVKFPPCDPADPYSVGEDTSEMYKALPAKAKSVSLELTFYDGEKSGVKVFGVK